MSTTSDATGLRGGLTSLLLWLNRYPQVQPVCVDYADGSEVELALGVQAGLGVLSAAAAAADALAGVVIEVRDPVGGLATELVVTGVAGGDGLAPLGVRVEGRADGEAQTLLLSAQDPPADPEVRRWTVTAEQLHALVRAGEAGIGAR